MATGSSDASRRGFLKSSAVAAAGATVLAGLDPVRAAHVAGKACKKPVGQGSQNGTNSKDVAGRKAIGQPGDRKAQGAKDEAELDGVGQRPEVSRLQAPACRQVICRAVRRKP